MKASAGFIFFMLFLAGIALVNLKGMQQQSDTALMSAAEIAGTEWRPTHIGQMRLQKESKMSLRFDTDNGVAGNAGCNRFFGAYKLADGLLEIGSLGSTPMACQEPEHSFELSFLSAMGSARSLSRVERRLIMRDEKGEIVARFAETSREDNEE